MDEAFWRLLEGITGPEILKTFRKENKYDDLEIGQKLEIKKRAIQPESSDPITFSLPHRLEDTYEKCSKSTLEKAIASEKKYNGKITLKRGKLKLFPDTAKSIFQESCNAIVSHVKTLLALPRVRDVRTVLMVGGFAESPMLQEAIKTNFPHLKIIIPPEAGMAVLKGAVLYGHEPHTLYSRVCRYTYGVEICLPFDKKEDDSRYMFTDSYGRKMCRSRFHVHVREGDEVTLNSPPVSQIITLGKRDQFHLSVPVYVSESGVPRYTTGCMKIGEVKIDIDDTSGKDRQFKVEMLFGHTESTVRVTDVSTKKIMISKFDFLG